MNGWRGGLFWVTDGSKHSVLTEAVDTFLNSSEQENLRVRVSLYLVLHFEYQNPHSTHEVRTFYPVLTTSKAFLMAKTWFWSRLRLELGLCVDAISPTIVKPV